MKILFLTLRADQGGGPYHVNLIIDNLPSSFNIFVASPEDKPYFDKWKSNKKVNGIFELLHRKFDINRLFLLNKYIKENKITIVHSHGKGAGIYSRLLKIINPKLKIIHTLHGLHIREYGLLKKNIYIGIEKFLSLFTNSFINVSFGEQELCLQYKLFPKYKSSVIHNGINQLCKVDKAKDKINLNDKFIVTTISRFDYAKNMSFAYKIAKKFKDNKKIVFLWLGDGDNKKTLEEQAKKEKVNIVFTGFIDDISLYLSATDIYLSTSRWEGLPYALVEAQSLGIPIVATNVIGNNEVVNDNINGFLFNTEDEANTIINKVYTSDILCKQISEQAIINFNSKFKIKEMIEKTIGIYK